MKRLAALMTLAGRSAWNRRWPLTLALFSIALSAFLLLGLARVRHQARENFVQAVSGADLVVGPRGGDLRLVLYAVFHLGGATDNLGWASAERLAALEEVAWTIPLSLGDYHRDFPVVATSLDFFTHYRYRGGESLAFSRGGPFADLFQVVLGAETAARLQYRLGDRLALSHGRSGLRAAEHGDHPFAVAGILKPTGSPVDRSLYISLEAMEAIHLGWRGGAPAPGLKIGPDQARKFNLRPKSVTALLVGLKNRSQVFRLQRLINAWPDEPLMAVLPGVALDQLWRLTGQGERALMLVSLLVTIAGLAGLASTMLAGLGERRRELAILRSVGARRLDIVLLLSLESLLLTLVGALAGLAALAAAILCLGPTLAADYGLALRLSPPTREEGLILAAIIGAGLAAGLLPARQAYRLSLADGLNVST